MLFGLFTTAKEIKRQYKKKLPVCQDDGKD